jgi:hypothetical protein
MAVPGVLILQHTTRIGTGMVPNYQAVNAQGDSFVNSPNAVLQFFNNSGGPFLVTIVGQQVCNQSYLHNYTQYIQPGQALPTIIGPFDFHYNDTNSRVQIRYQWISQGVNASSITVALVGP